MDHTQATIVGIQCFRKVLIGNRRLPRFGFPFLPMLGFCGMRRDSKLDLVRACLL